MIDIIKLDELVDIVGLSVYTNRVKGGVRFLKMRQFCIDQGEVNIKEKDHQYELGRYYLDAYKKTNKISDAFYDTCNHFIKDDSDTPMIDEYVHTQGGEGISLRAKIYETIRKSKRGCWALFKIESGFSTRLDAVASNGYGSIVSSKSLNISFDHIPTSSEINKLIITFELKIIIEKINRELERQSNLCVIEEKKIKPGCVIGNIHFNNYPKVSKIKVNDVDDKGNVYYEMIGTGVQAKNRKHKIIEARLLYI